jgi:heat shock protein HslJ
MPYSSREQAGPCPPALAAQGSKLAKALAKIDTYEDTGDELHLIGAGQVLARFAPAHRLWPRSTLLEGATFWAAAEVGGDATAGDDRLTLNLVGGNATGNAGACKYSGHVRHGHGEITFWNLAATSGPCREARLHAHLDALTRATHYTLESDALVLRAADGSVLARFQANAGDITGTWRLVDVAGRSPPAAIELWLPDGKMRGVKSCADSRARIRLGDGMVVLIPAPSAWQSECRLAGTAGPGLPPSISRATWYEVSGDELTFFDDGKKIAVWRRVRPTAQ